MQDKNGPVDNSIWLELLIRRPHSNILMKGSTGPDSLQMITDAELNARHFHLHLSTVLRESTVEINSLVGESWGGGIIMNPYPGPIEPNEQAAWPPPGSLLDVMASMGEAVNHFFMEVADAIGINWLVRTITNLIPYRPDPRVQFLEAALATSVSNSRHWMTKFDEANRELDRLKLKFEIKADSTDLDEKLAQLKLLVEQATKQLEAEKRAFRRKGLDLHGGCRDESAVE